MRLLNLHYANLSTWLGAKEDARRKYAVVQCQHSPHSYPGGPRVSTNSSLWLGILSFLIEGLVGLHDSFIFLVQFRSDFAMALMGALSAVHFRSLSSVCAM